MNYKHLKPIYLKDYKGEFTGFGILDSKQNDVVSMSSDLKPYLPTGELKAVKAIIESGLFYKPSVCGSSELERKAIKEVK